MAAESNTNNVWIAAGDGDLEAVKLAVQSGVDVNAKDENGYSPVHAAASYARMDVLAWLIENGGDVNAKDNDGDTPLHHCESRESASFLVQHGADPKTTNNAGSTPAETAAEDQNEELCQFYGTVEDQQQQAAKNAPQ